MPNELTNPNDVVTEERLAQFYQQILPYLGGMPDILANKFNRADLYSTDEKLIGRWIDGKPLYQKTVSWGALPNNVRENKAHNISNIDLVISVSGIAYNSDKSVCLSLPQVSNDTLCIRCTADKRDIIIVTYQDRTYLSSTYVILQYTKTTDSAVDIGSDTDYSTTEKIVGTWIDGKPIWQKTVSYGALPNNNIKDVAHGISNIDKITSYYAISSNTSGTACNLPCVAGGGSSAVNPIGCTVDKTKVHVWCFDDRTAYINTYVTIQYTKTSS